MIAICPSCGRSASVSRAVLGKLLTCPQCATAFTIGAKQVPESAASYRLRVAMKKALVVILGMIICGAMFLFPPCWADKGIRLIGGPSEPKPIETELRWGYEQGHLGGHNPMDSG